MVVSKHGTHFSSLTNPLVIVLNHFIDMIFKNVSIFKPKYILPFLPFMYVEAQLIAICVVLTCEKLYLALGYWCCLICLSPIKSST